MKKKLFFLVMLLAVVGTVGAEEFIFDSSLYGVQELTVDVDITNTIYLDGSIRELKAILRYYPHTFDSQTVTSEQTSPPATRQDNAYVFTWNNPTNPAQLHYAARVQSNYNRPKISEAIPYPLAYVPPDIQQYLGEQEIIRMTPEIRALAADIVGNEDDAVRATFLLGRWVKDNIVYDLNSVTAEATQTSDWVLEHKTGVCDELTSLFIAMLRSQGIPARFVSGVAYTNLEELDSPWGPHGWAEVWFPGQGWVPYDVTYGQYGYVDATHIAFTTSADAKNNALEYTLMSQGGHMEPNPLHRVFNLVSKGDPLSEDLDMQAEMAIEEIGFGGANRVDVTVQNKRNYYVSTELFLAKTAHLLTDDHSSSILLAPKETRTLHWIVSVDKDLEEGFRYTFPVVIYTNQNTSVVTNFSASKRGVLSDESDLAITQERVEKALPKPLTCTAPSRVRVGQPINITCTYPSTLTICLDTCEKTTTLTREYTFDEVGARSFKATAEDGEAKTQTVITIVVEDEPRVELSAQAPESLGYDETGTMHVYLTPTSTAIPENVTLRLSHPLFTNAWEFPLLSSQAVADLSITGAQLASGENTIEIEASYPTGEGVRTERTRVVIVAHGESFGEKLWLWINSVSAYFATA